jgi:hypothetical protein
MMSPAAGAEGVAPFGLPHPDACPCCVRNKHLGGVPDGATYIGRGSKWGNPFRIGADGDRAVVIAKHEAWLRTQRDLLKAIDELRGRDLVCFCAPQACHGDILLALANADREARVLWWLDGRPHPKG